jgi:hypothetical protein
MPEPTNPTTDAKGYSYDETSDWWKQMCEPLSSFSEVWWPDYSTKVVEAMVGTTPIVIQLWKGWCQKFLGRQDFPGGIGAEVGIYHRVEGKKPPEKLPHFPPKLSTYILGGLSKLGDVELWWPFPELKTSLTFELINPVTQQTFISAGPETTYWLNKWMNPDSYEKYKTDQGGKTPIFSSHYVLKYTINGTSYQW